MNQLAILSNSLLVRLIKVSKLAWEATTVVSSANNINLKNEEHSHKSLMYNKNKSGPRIEPWGTPQLTLDKGEVDNLYEVN